MTIEEISAQLGISQKQLRKLVASGAIAYKKDGSSYDISKTELKRVKKAILDGSLIQETKESKQVERFGNVEKQKREVNWVDISADWKRPSRCNLTFVDLLVVLVRAWKWLACMGSVV